MSLLTALSKLRSEVAAGTLDLDAAHTRVRDLYEDMHRDYVVNERRVDALERRWKLHLQPIFGADLATSITTPRLRLYIQNRLAEEAKRATVQRELAALRRMFRLGVQ